MVFSWDYSFVYPLYFPASKDLLVARAQSLRKRQTAAETNLFKLLHKLGERPVNRQVVIYNMIIDITIPARNLLIEVDGSVHQTNSITIEKDKRKNAILRELGFNLVRIDNDHVTRKWHIKNLLSHYPRRDQHKEAYYNNLRYANDLWEHKINKLMQRYQEYSPDHLMFKWIASPTKQAIAQSIPLR